MDDVSPDVVSDIQESWQRVKRSSPTGQDDFGEAFFQHLFTKAPMSFKLLFPFGTLPKMTDDPTYRSAATTAGSIMDLSVSQLECELDMIFGQLLEIGLEHSNFPRIRPEHWKHIQASLMQALNEKDTSMNDSTQQAWEQVLHSIFQEMAIVIKPMRRRSWDASAGGSAGSSSGNSTGSSNPHISDQASHQNGGSHAGSNGSMGSESSLHAI